MEKKKRARKKDALSLVLQQEDLQLLNLYKQAYQRCCESERLLEQARTQQKEIKKDTADAELIIKSAAV